MRLFVPLEVVNREYASRLLVAAEAARRGVEVIFGHKGPVLNSALSQMGGNSVWLGRGSINLELLSRGLSLVGHDEESGIIYDDYSDYYKQRPGLRNINSAEKFFCWGPEDHEYLTSFHAEKHSCLETRFPFVGSPRAALWGPLGAEFYENEITNIRKKYGDYVLLVSNLARGNSILGRGLSNYVKDLGNWENMNGIVKSAIEKENRLLRFFAHCAKGLVKEFNLKVIIRAHPLESAKTWRNAVKDIKNIHVVSGGCLTPWILGSTAIIHNSCTSGIEAACIGTPAIALGEKDCDLETSGASFSNSLSISAIGESQLYKAFNSLDSVWLSSKNDRGVMLNRKLFRYGEIKAITGTVSELISIQPKVAEEEARTLSNDLARGYGAAKNQIMPFLPVLTGKQRLQRQKRPEIGLNRLNADLVKCSNMINSNVVITASEVRKNLFKIAL